MTPREGAAGSSSPASSFRWRSRPWSVYSGQEGALADQAEEDAGGQCPPIAWKIPEPTRDRARIEDQAAGSPGSGYGGGVDLAHGPVLPADLVIDMTRNLAVAAERSLLCIHLLQAHCATKGDRNRSRAPDHGCVPRSGAGPRSTGHSDIVKQRAYHQRAQVLSRHTIRTLNASGRDSACRPPRSASRAAGPPRSSLDVRRRTVVTFLIR